MQTTYRVGLDHRLDAYSDGTHIAELVWRNGTGEILSVWTHPEYRRQGIATRLFRMAQTKPVPPRHSRNVTADGRKWIKNLKESA